MINKLTETIKSYGTTITTLFTIIATIGGAVLYVENNYAAAQDVREVLRNQQAQIAMQQQSQRSSMMFRLEYYDDRLAKLHEERRIAEERERNRINNRAVQKTAREIEEEIKEVKERRELVKRSIVETERTALPPPPAK